MRRFLVWSFGIMMVLALIGVTVALVVHYVAPVNGMTIAIDGERLEGPAVAALFGTVAAIGVLIATALVVVVLASVAIVVPVAIVLVLVAVLGAVLIGLSPILVPVVLLVGASVLLSRRNRRRAVTTATT